MSEESAFLTHLAANPGDDLTRLVYADWLDERGDERAGFLRAEQELARHGEDDLRAAELARELSERMRSIRWDWLAVAGKRWDMWLTSFAPPQKITTIKAVRWLTGCGLAEGKVLVESAPVCVLSNCTRAEAEMACEHFRRCNAAADAVGMAIRACPAPGAETMFRIVRQCEVVIQGYRRLDAREAVLVTLRSHLPWMSESFDAGGLPCVFRWLGEPKARAIAEAIKTWAEVDVVPTSGEEERVVRVPILAGRACPGPFEVRLLRYPPENQTAVLAAIRNLIGNQGPSAAGQTQRVPIILRLGVDGAEAERVRRLFADLGEVEIGATVTP